MELSSEEQNALVSRFLDSRVDRWSEADEAEEAIREEELLLEAAQPAESKR